MGEGAGFEVAVDYVGAVFDALARDAITFTDATYYLEANVAMVERMESSLAGGRG